MGAIVLCPHLVEWLMVAAEAGDDGDVLGDLQGQRGQEGREVHQRQRGAAHQGQLPHKVSLLLCTAT